MASRPPVEGMAVALIWGRPESILKPNEALGILMGILTVLVSTPSFALIPVEQRTINIKLITIEKPVSNKITNEKVALVVPVGLQPSKNPDTVKNQIMDHSLQSLINGAYFADSDILDSVKKIENAMKADMVIGGSEPGSIQHKLEMKVDAFQKRANFSYQGAIQADVKVNNTNNSVEFIIQRALSEHADLIVNHQTESQRSFVQMNFDW